MAQTFPFEGGDAIAIKVNFVYTYTYIYILLRPEIWKAEEIKLCARPRKLWHFKCVRSNAENGKMHISIRNYHKFCGIKKPLPVNRRTYNFIKHISLCECACLCERIKSKVGSFLYSGIAFADYTLEPAALLSSRAQLWDSHTHTPYIIFLSSLNSFVYIFSPQLTAALGAFDFITAIYSPMSFYYNIQIIPFERSGTICTVHYLPCFYYDMELIKFNSP